MFIWNPNLTLDSKLIPGVRYHFKRFSAGRRADLELQLADYREKVREASVRYNEALEDVPENGEALAARKTALELLREYVGKPLTDDALNSVAQRAIDLMPVYKSEQYRRNQARFGAYVSEMESLTNRFEKSAKLRCYLKRVEISVDGEREMTVEEFISDGPEELAGEALGYIHQNGGLSADELKNSPSLSDSCDPAATEASSTTAGTAETTATIAIDTAPATPLNA